MMGREVQSADPDVLQHVMSIRVDQGRYISPAHDHAAPPIRGVLGCSHVCSATAQQRTRVVNNRNIEYQYMLCSLGLRY